MVPQNITLVPSRPVELDEIFSEHDDDDDDDDDDDGNEEGEDYEIKENDEEIVNLFDRAFEIDMTALFDVIDD